jgi:hypothetical protein
MKKQKEIRHLLRKWMSLNQMLDEDKDVVSRMAQDQIKPIIKTLKWVLE